MIALCSKTYILKKHDDKKKISSKGLNKVSLTNPFSSYQEVLQSGQTKSFTNQGFFTRDNTIYTYQQSKAGLSYFYCKQEVLADGKHTKPLTITLSPWVQRELEVVDENHPWSLLKEYEFKIEDQLYKASLADVCAYTPDALGHIIPHLPRHIPQGKVIIALPNELKKQDMWKRDSYWTTGVSPRTSPLLLNTPGQNKLGEMIEEFMRTNVTELMDHDYL